ncbi:hypothetical protein FM106_21220 [Brachybacterium faecium]|nr:hypothetical protein FM106_21220 [Brachybacterium faecium]
MEEITKIAVIKMMVLKKVPKLFRFSDSIYDLFFTKQSW